MTRRGTAGGTTVEFAIVGSAFVTLLLLATETGWQLVVDAALQAGARAAARFGTTGSTAPSGMTPPPASRTAAVQQIVVQNSGGVLLASRLSITETSYANFAAIGQPNAGATGPGNAQQVVQYGFTYQQPFLTPIAAAVLGTSTLGHSVSLTVVNEPFPSN